MTICKHESVLQESKLTESPFVTALGILDPVIPTGPDLSLELPFLFELVVPETAPSVPPAGPPLMWRSTAALH